MPASAACCPAGIRRSGTGSCFSSGSAAAIAVGWGMVLEEGAGWNSHRQVLGAKGEPGAVSCSVSPGLLGGLTIEGEGTASLGVACLSHFFSLC